MKYIIVLWLFFLTLMIIGQLMFNQAVIERGKIQIKFNQEQLKFNQAVIDRFNR